MDKIEKLQSLRGTKDLLPDSFVVHAHIVSIAEKIGSLYGYLPMSTPIIEHANVFTRTLGDTSDVVSKEMYNFTDRSGNNIALRPEFTAGVMRAFISNNITNLPLKFFSHGPLFRYDRPQLGRQRQLHQINYEYIGAEGPHSDAEVIKLAYDLLNALEIENLTTLEINSLGCTESRKLYHQKLFEYLCDNKAQLSTDSLSKLERNPLRILDSKSSQDLEIIKNAPSIYNFYTDYSKSYFEQLLKYLDMFGIKYLINHRLVRGLDYYCHTAFEFTTKSIGAQSSVIGGGRYDKLAEIMGGMPTPAIGFAAGIERLALMRSYEFPKVRPLCILPIGDENIDMGLKIADHLRQNQILSLLDTKGKIEKRLARALEKDAKYVIFIGDEERTNSKYKIKNLDSRIENTVSILELMSIIKSQE
ncbi:MAG: histidine--tRNA ligase [Rickettsiaceae bacterium]|nr:MAG: histidine--tRNA ligase [Rickettsiaceae bacterium]